MVAVSYSFSRSYNMPLQKRCGNDKYHRATVLVMKIDTGQFLLLVDIYCAIL